MGKKKKSSSDGKKVRYRTNPLTGQTEEVPGARSGRNKVYLPVGHPLRTHDLKGPANKGKKKDTE